MARLRQSNMWQLGEFEVVTPTTAYPIGPLDLNNRLRGSLQFVDTSVGGPLVAGTMTLEYSNDNTNWMDSGVAGVVMVAGDESKSFNFYNFDSRYLRFVFTTTGAAIAAWKIKAIMCSKNSAELAEN
tara:strand:+ start:505 stop:885 length:381 start_codon:yes stop_codon:yes gene_type:complete